jgi:CheY-like chemotaxis protein
LRQAGYQVIPARDGLEAMRQLSIFAPDLILLDLMMPRFNGDEVLHFIRTNPFLTKVPVIILSTNSVLDAAQEHLLESSRKRLIKSLCTPATLLTAIEEVLTGAPAETASPASNQIPVSFSPELHAATA